MSLELSLFFLFSEQQKNKNKNMKSETYFVINMNLGSLSVVTHPTSSKFQLI